MVGGALVLLSGMLISRITQLTKNDVIEDGQATCLAIDGHRLMLPPRLADLVRQPSAIEGVIVADAGRAGAGAGSGRRSAGARALARLAAEAVPRCRAFRLPDPSFEPSFEEFRSF